MRKISFYRTTLLLSFAIVLNESTRKREFKPSRISAGAKSFWKAEREDEKKET